MIFMSPKPLIIRYIAPSLDNEIKNLIETIKKSFGREIGYKQATKVYASLSQARSQRLQLMLTAKKLNEILGAADYD